MAEQAVNSVVSAVAGELASRVFSGLMQRYGTKDAATSEKLWRLEMLLIKIHSAVEASEKHAVVNPWLLRWRDKLKEAASQGDEVLARFPPLVKDTDADANQQQGEETASSSAAAAPHIAAGAQSFSKKSLSDVAQGICVAGKMVFRSVDDDMERLNKTLKRLEKLSPDIGEFIRLLHLEALPKGSPPEEEKTKEMPERGIALSLCEDVDRAIALSLCEDVDRAIALSLRSGKDDDRAIALSLCSGEDDDLAIALSIALALCSGEDVDDEQTLSSEDFERDSAVIEKLMPLDGRLEAALVAICEAVELAGSCDLENVEWLAFWARVLQKAKQQGCAVHSASIGAAITISKEDNKELVFAVEVDHEKVELGSFVHRLEGLASDVEYFSKLVYLCRVR